MPSKKIISLSLIQISSALILSACGGSGASNQEPTIKGASFTIPENAKKGYAVGKVTGKDEDGDKLTYSIVNGKGIFAINKDNGRISLAKNSVFSPAKPLKITVKVADTEAQTATATVNIKIKDVNIIPASILNNTNFSIANIATKGAVVGILGSATDGLTYSIVGGNTGSAFAIDPKTGKITVNNASALAGSFQLQIKVTDPISQLSDIVTLTIAVNNQSLIPAGFNPNVGINGANVKNGANVGTPLGSANDGLTYSIVGGNGAFAIDPKTGQITIKDSSLIQPGSTVQLTIRITNADGTLSQTVTIPVTIGSLFTGNSGGTPTATIGDNASNGALVGTPIGNANDGLTYSITGGNNSGAFSIDPLTGQIFVNDAAALGTAGIFDLQITATNSAGVSETITIQISVNKPPQISLSNNTMTLLRRAAAGTVIGKIIVDLRDATSVTDRELFVSSTTGVSPEFSINEENEIILEEGVTLAGPYTLDAVYISDKGNSNTLPITINIVNDFKGKTAKVIAFGNSITAGEGYSVDDLNNKNRPVAPTTTLADVPKNANGNSYRLYVRDTQGQNGVKVDFDGTRKSDWADDIEHEGWSGYNSMNIIDGDGGNDPKPLQILKASGKIKTADIVLITLGTNDALVHSVSDTDINTGLNLRNIIEQMRDENPNLVFLLANVVPIDNHNTNIFKFGKYDPNDYPDVKTKPVEALAKFQQDLDNTNQYMRTINEAIVDVAKDLSTSSSPVRVVDMISELTDSCGTTDTDKACTTITPFIRVRAKSELFSDGIHPNDAGEKVMAKKWVEALDPFFDGNDDGTP